MSSSGGGGNGYKYYDYLKKYDAHFLNKYESWTHQHWGRRSNYLQLLYFRAYSLFTSRAPVLPNIKVKKPFLYVACVVCLADIWGTWIFQEVYNKYMPWKWVYYQPYFKESCIQME
jgi:hypothetical protein